MADNAAVAEPPKPTTPAAEKSDSDFLSRFYSGKRKPEPVAEKQKDDEKPKDQEPTKESPKADATKAEPKPDAKPEKKDDKPQKPKAKKAEPVVPPPPAPMDFKEMGKEIAKGVADGLEKREKKSDQPDLAPEERELFSKIERLEKKYPALYANRTKKFVQSLRNADEYETRWLAAHPGEAFDIDADEHAAFRESNGLDDIDDAHFKEIEDDILAEKIEARVDKKYSQKLDALESEKKLREAAPGIIGARVGAARKFFDDLGSDFKGVLDDKGNIVGTEIEKLSADPTKSLALPYAQAVEEFADTSHRLINKLDDLDAKNPAHSAVLGYVSSLESSIKSMPVEDQMWNGKRFATGDEWEALPANQRQHYWILSEGYINNCYAAQKSAEAKAMIEREETRLAKFAEARGWRRQDEKQAQPNPETKSPAAEKPKETPKDSPPSPPAIADTRMAPPVGAAAGGNGSATRSFISLFGGK